MNSEQEKGDEQHIWTRGGEYVQKILGEKNRVSSYTQGRSCSQQIINDYIIWAELMIMICFIAVTVNHAQQKNNFWVFKLIKLSPVCKNSQNHKGIQRSTFKMQVAKHTHSERHTMNVNEADQEHSNGYGMDLCVLTSHRWCELVREGVPARGQERWPGLQPATWETKATDMWSGCCSATTLRLLQQLLLKLQKRKCSRKLT